MNVKKTIASAACAALLLAGAAVAQMHHGHMGKAGMAGMEEHIASVLNLTDAQKASAKQLHADLKAKAAPLMEQSRQQHQELKQLLEGTNPDATAIGEKMIAAHATHAQLKALHDDFKTRFSALLNADQKAKLQQLEQTRMQRWHGEGPGEPPADF